ncbi:MAG: hypothetical protein DWQ02_04345 [Bacteroidetes bacterium]|nr:MAG: hypothetical protein DWQ02_04345 [Bacteroidota bacterium]
MPKVNAQPARGDIRIKHKALFSNPLNKDFILFNPRATIKNLEQFFSGFEKIQFQKFGITHVYH